MWSSRGLRGSTLENLINMTNDAYRKKNLAIIQKTPTPITTVKFDTETKMITQAFYEQKSTVDYIGVVQGFAICFDAKETANKSLPIQNIHAHQIEFMSDFEKQKGIAFIIVHFTFCDEYYFLPFTTLLEYYENSKKGGRKSIPYDEFNYKIPCKGTLNYLIPLNEYLEVKALLEN